MLDGAGARRAEAAHASRTRCKADPRLSDDQRAALMSVYRSFVDDDPKPHAKRADSARAAPRGERRRSSREVPRGDSDWEVRVGAYAAFTAGLAAFLVL